MQIGETLYRHLCDNDFLGWTRPLWDGGSWTVGDDGILTVPRRQVAVDTPWLHHGHSDWADCMRWHTIAFNVISKRMKMLFPEGNNDAWVPTHCMNCWKTVVKPRNIFELFALNEMQENIEIPCKCGIEPRPTCERNYGGYHYARGYKEGHEMYRYVRDKVDNYPNLGVDVPVILKRACTEMEAECGPSSKWKVTDRQLHIESLVNRWIGNTREENDRDQPENVVIRVKRKWLEYAASVGDLTYMAFTGGEHINEPYETYHEREYKPGDFEECYG